MRADFAAPLVVERIGRDDMSLRALATLRMTVFRGWPYFYDGSFDYEANYLAEFLSDDAAVLVVARMGEIPVGMATASPMSTQSDVVKAPFQAREIELTNLFYFGESVLLPQFRGLGIGHRFFDEREAAARTAGASHATFCAVVREANHPSRPQGTRDLISFWEKRGYRLTPQLGMTMRWKEVGQREETDHRMALLAEIAIGARMTDIRIAAAQYPIELLTSYGAWEAKLSRWVFDAAKRGAQLLVFPEYAAMELAGCDSAAAGDLQASLRHVMSLGAQIDELHRQLSIHYGVTILGGSRPCGDERGQIVNRARLFCPDGRSGYQDKIVMTRFEREIWGIAGGEAISVVETAIGRVGISICYDAEFPLIARAQAEAGAQIILVPSATDSIQGYWRVRIGAQARALENQCYVVQAPAVGEAPWLPSLDDNHGAAAIYGPPDDIAPDDGVFAVGEVNRPEWVFGDIQLDQVGQWRQNGTVLPFYHWSEQRVPVRTNERDLIRSLPDVSVPHDLSERLLLGISNESL